MIYIFVETPRKENMGTVSNGRQGFEGMCLRDVSMPVKTTTIPDSWCSPYKQHLLVQAAMPQWRGMIILGFGMNNSHNSLTLKQRHESGTPLRPSYPRALPFVVSRHKGQTRFPMPIYKADRDRTIIVRYQV